MKDKKIFASFLIYLGSALCFLLPFATVSCGGMSVLTMDGEQLAVGTTITQPQPFGPPQRQKIHADPLAFIGLLGGVAGVALSLVGRKMATAAAVSGGVGAVSLLFMQHRMHEKIQGQSGGMATVHMQYGFTLAVSLLVVGAIWNTYMRLERNVAGDVSIPESEAMHNDNQTTSVQEGPLSG
jgi:hypothetical protein